MELKFYIKKRQLFDLYGNPIIAVGTNPTNIGVQSGVIPNNDWIDITDDIDSGDNFKITFTEARDSNGNVSSTAGVRFTKKTATGEFNITGDAYRYIYAWIYESPTSIYNSFSLRVEDVGCGNYDQLVIGRSSIEFCESEICRFSLSVRQEDDVYHCIQKTLIADNWQGWFQANPSGGKKYPRYSYCNEPKSTWSIQLIWFLLFNIVVGNGAFMFILIPVINSIIWIINIFTNPNLPYMSPGGITESVATLMFESAGCGREHPAPFIRDYIKNVCDKCGVAVDETTFPVFFSTTLTMSTAGGQVNNVNNPHYNATWLAPELKKGVRRYKDLWAEMTLQDQDTTTFFQEENAPKIALSDFLDILKYLYNSEWRIREVNGVQTLFFLRKDWFLNGQYVYNFQEGSPDRDKIIQGICFEPMDVTFPAYVDGIYQADPLEQGNVEVLDAYNGKAYSFGQLTESNALYEGVVADPTNFVAPTKFSLDGSDEDYIYDSFQLALNSAWLNLGVNIVTNPFAPAIINNIAKNMAEFVNKYVNNCIYLQGDTVGFGRVLIWDGNSMLNARAIRLHSGVESSISTKPLPVPQPLYNSTSFSDLHPRKTRVRGLGSTFGSNIQNAFQVKWVLGNVYLKSPCELPNYPMYFNPGFKGTLWDWFWFIEDPRFQQNMGLKWSVEIENCCDDRNKLGVFTHSENLKLGYMVKLPLNHIFTGVIEEIEVDYGVKQGVGRTIRISGTV